MAEFAGDPSWLAVPSRSSKNEGWWGGRGSNPQPSVSKTDALSIELPPRKGWANTPEEPETGTWVKAGVDHQDFAGVNLNGILAHLGCWIFASNRPASGIHRLFMAKTDRRASRKLYVRTHRLTHTHPPFASGSPASMLCQTMGLKSA